ncbi:hypothetical protein [Geitlerinema calcuttense]|uniref:Uncharacterized protein n=1 Tax=Geitlerinema calcuttense NRMC-F 0142 TaxID=2922238 RepID=A0ABT7LV27_9CYAN|nr:hypothetical protein [Geitlerinema calcuttense]MDL5055887.1 hypothetical protein [Geitlerinema calcuttense NRMC-F 0142]
MLIPIKNLGIVETYAEIAEVRGTDGYSHLFCTQNGKYYQRGVPGQGWVEVPALQPHYDNIADRPTGGGGGPVAWADVTGKPSEFTPSAHSHDGYAASSHNHDGSYAASNHTHAIANITNLQTALDGKQASLVSGTNIKTVNGESVLGAGNIVVSGADPAGWTTIVKSANQDVTDAGLTNDTDFHFTVVNGGHYAVEMDLIVSGNNATGDYTMDFQMSTGNQRGKGTCQGLNASNAVQNIIVTAAGVQATTAIVTGAPTADLNDLVFVKVSYAFTALADATFQFRFGNAAAASGRTSRTWKGSVLRHKRLD